MYQGPLPTEVFTLS